MNRLPDRSNLYHLKKQAKDLIRLYRRGDAEAIARFRRALPEAAAAATMRSRRSSSVCTTRISYERWHGPQVAFRSTISIYRRSTGTHWISS
jgi:hypothetical protein